MHSGWFSLMIYWRTDVQMMSSLKLFLILCYIKQIDSKLPCILFSNRSQMSKCGKNISDTLSCTLCAIICDLLLNRCTATWNLFVKCLYMCMYVCMYVCKFTDV